MGRLTHDIATTSATFIAAVNALIATALANFLNTANVWTKAQSGAYVALASAANSVPVNLALSNNYTLPMTENTTLAAPSNVTPGQSGAIEVTQDAGVAYTLAYNAFWKWAGGSPGTISATLASKSVICYLTDSTGTFATCTMNAGVA